MIARTPSGLSDDEKARLLKRMGTKSAPGEARPSRTPAVARRHDLAGFEFFQQMQVMRSAGEMLGIPDPFLRPHEGRAGAETVIGGQRVLNFSSYSYLGLNGHPAVNAAAKAAIDRYGTSASASRVVAGERPVHRELETRLASLYEAEDAVAFVSGHAANVTVIGHLMGPGDLVVHDALIHNSVVQGAQLSGARRLSFPHNDADALDRLLAEQKPRQGRTLLVIEGHYSMDGDIPDLAAFVAVARRRGAWLMVDEAHALGVLGETGRGLAEHCGVDPASVDLWMGTLSKTLAGCGGYIAGRGDLIEYLKLTAPGFVYSVGMPPPIAAAAAAALDLMLAEPERIAKLRDNAARFVEHARAADLDIGLSAGFSIVPVITGSSIVAGRLSHALLQRGVNVQPILYPAVAERSARLRFFLSSEHEPDQIRRAVEETAAALRDVKSTPVDLQALSRQLGG